MKIDSLSRISNLRDFVRIVKLRVAAVFVFVPQRVAATIFTESKILNFRNSC
jgi:hypothetical protein